MTEFFERLNRMSDEELIATPNGKIPFFLSAKSATTREDVMAEAQTILRTLEEKEKSWHEKAWGKIFIGVIIGLIILLISLFISKKQTQDTPQSPPTTPPPNVAERGVILIDLGYSLYAVRLSFIADERTKTFTFPNGLDLSRVNAQLTALYRRLGLTMPDAKPGPNLDLVKATKSILPDDSDRQCHNVGWDIGAAQAIGIGMIVRPDTHFQEMGRQKISEVSTSLRESRLSLGILEIVERNGNIESRIVPMFKETADAYVTRIRELKASIIGAYRQRYGPISKRAT